MYNVTCITLLMKWLKLSKLLLLCICCFLILCHGNMIIYILFDRVHLLYYKKEIFSH